MQKKTISWYNHFSYSQSAVGILTLGWSNSSHKKTVYDIRRLILDLDWDCVAAVERLPALHYSVDFILLSFGNMGFIVEV